MLPRPVFARTKATSSRFSLAWVCTRIPEAADSAATASSSVREHDTAKRGASAMRIRPSAWPCQRRCRSTLASMPARHGSCSRAGASPPSSIRHLPTVARMPVGAMASSTASVSCTVSIVSTVVVPVRSSSWTASRAEAAQRRRRVRRFERPHALLEPLEQRQVVGQAPEQGLAQVDVGLDEAGEEVAAAGGNLAIGRRRAGRRRPDPGDHAVRDPHVPGDDRAVVIHREDGGVADPEGGQMRTSTRYFALRLRRYCWTSSCCLRCLRNSSRRSLDLGERHGAPGAPIRQLDDVEAELGLDQAADFARS